MAHTCWEAETKGSIEVKSQPGQKYETPPEKQTKSKYWALVTHTYNPSYSRGRDQEDHGSKPARANSLQDAISKKSHHKKSWWSGSRCRPWVQAPVLQKNKYINKKYKQKD
jgi:hypothetical protein